MRVNPNYANDILNSIWQTQQQEQTATEELSTGKRVNMPSDDPTAAAEDVENQAQQSQVDQYLSNTTDVEGQLQAADSSLGSVVTALTQAVSLGTEAASAGLSSSDLQSIAQQLQGIQSQVLQFANTSYQGTYIFAGTATGSAPYSLDSAKTDGVQYNGNTEVNSVEIAEGRSIQVNLPGSQIFQNSNGDVFGTLQQLTTAVQSGDSTNIGTAMTQLNGALTTLSEQRVFYGNAVSQLTANQTSLQQEQVDLQSQETNLVGADMATAATDLSQAQTTNQAALAALAKIMPVNLLDYLQ
jgi:flagellar hook-associated protein 3 FlgL